MSEVFKITPFVRYKCVLFLFTYLLRVSVKSFGCKNSETSYLIFQILKSIATSCIYLPSRGKIKICHFLRRSVDDLDCRVQSVASILTGLFVHLLENENPWVRQEALETFEHMGQRCSEQLIAKIAKALAKIPNISSVMQAYLSSRPYYSLEGFANIQDYLRYLVGAIKNRDGHTCYKYNVSMIKDTS